MAVNEITRMMVDSYLTTAITENRKIADRARSGMRKLLWLDAADFDALADELERIRDEWRLRRRMGEPS